MNIAIFRSRMIVQTIYAFQCITLSVFGLYCGQQLRELSKTALNPIEIENFSWISKVDFSLEVAKRNTDSIQLVQAKSDVARPAAVKVRKRISAAKNIKSESRVDRKLASVEELSVFRNIRKQWGAGFKVALSSHPQAVLAKAKTIPTQRVLKKSKPVHVATQKVAVPALVAQAPIVSKVEINKLESTPDLFNRNFEQRGEGSFNETFLESFSQRARKSLSDYESYIEDTKSSKTQMEADQVTEPKPLFPGFFAALNSVKAKPQVRAHRENTNTQVNSQKTPDKTIQENNQKRDVPETSNQFGIAQHDINNELEETLPYIEAFTKSTPVHGVTTEVLSDEGFVEDSTGKWIVAKAPEHISTLFLTRESSQLKKSTPLISQNSHIFLSRISQTSRNTKTGIVFGHLEPGQEITGLTGRADSPIYLDSEFNVIGPENDKVASWFIFLNVEPAAHLLNLRSKKHGPFGIGIPVREGVATLVDLSRERVQSVTVLVHDGSPEEENRESRTKVSLEIPGNPRPPVLVKFETPVSISNVVFVGDYPVYFDAVMPGKFRHRYRLTSSETTKDIFLFSENQIQNWIGQLSGGLSPESGLVVAALPSLKKILKSEQLYPEAWPLNDRSVIAPETYVLSESGQLLVKQPLEASVPRFITVQVPEGFNLIRLENAERKIKWSQLQVASPGVINVIGP